MSTFGINCGHTKSGYGSGAVGIISESEHTRLVGYEVMRLIKSKGHTVVDCTIDYANNVTESLSKITDVANNVNLDWFVSIHFNAGGGRGTEVYTYEGRQYEDALEICDNISKLGFKNRGVKAGTGLYVIRRTKAKSMLIEVCFVDTEDANQYLKVGYKAIAKAIVEALVGYVNSTIPSDPAKKINYDDSVKDRKAKIVNIQSYLNVRYTPGGKIIGSLKNGQEITLWRLEGDWYHIYSPVSGYNQAYVHKNYVQISQSNSSSIDTSNLDGKVGYINTPSGVNVRDSKSTSGKILGTLQNGAKVNLFRREGDWIHIYYPPYGGYIYSKYVKY